MKMPEMIKLLRPNQWYKNLVIFFAIIFSKNVFDFGLLKITFLGFVMLIIISSANYILNDLVDMEKDKINPEKKKRPLASGNVSIGLALVLFFILLNVGLISSYFFNTSFFYIVLGLFVISTLYTFYFKHLILVDLIAISSNFVLRAIAGAVIIGVFVSPWLILGIFFFALFLVTGKRYGELNYLEENASKHRKILGEYTKEFLVSLFNIFTGVLILIFALYTFSSEHGNLIWTLPLFIYIILRYYYLILSNNKIIRHPEKAFSDMPLLISVILFLLLGFILIFI